MIKLIVTDVDDTVVKEGSRNLNPEYFEVIREFRKKGVLFAVASGRQKPSIRKTFAPVEDQLIFLADNGTDITAKDFITSMKFNDEDYRQLAADIKALDDEYEIMACKPGYSFIERKNENYYKRMTESYGYYAEIVEDVSELNDVCKVSLFCKNGIAPEVEKKMKALWSDKIDVCLAGELFLDFMAKGCNKGKALSIIQEHYNIKPEETVAFGNADNDVSMIQNAGHSYAVANASDNLKNAAKEIIGPMKEDAVLKKMKELLKEL